MEMQMIMSINEQALEQAVLQRLMQVLPTALHDAIHDGLAHATTPRRIMNFVREPVPGSPAAAMWAFFDQTPEPTSKQVAQTCAKYQWNPKVVEVEYNRWKKFNSH